MPTYDYACPECGYKIEVFHGMNVELSQSCPECGNELKRLIGGGIGVLMKNSVKGTGNSCCGNENPCDNPKRCCTK